MVIRLGFNSSWVKPTRGRGSHWVNVTHQQLKVSGNKNLHPTCLFRCPKTSLVRVGQSHLSTQLWSFKKISWFLIAQFIPRFILLVNNFNETDKAQWCFPQFSRSFWKKKWILNLWKVFIFYYSNLMVFVLWSNYHPSNPQFGVCHSRSFPMSVCVRVCVCTDIYVHIYRYSVNMGIMSI